MDGIDLRVWAVFNSAIGGFGSGIQGEDLCGKRVSCFWEFIAKGTATLSNFLLSLPNYCGARGVS